MIRSYIGNTDVGLRYLGDVEVYTEGTFRITVTSLNIDYLIVAGGGAGGTDNGGGGGAGGLISGSTTLISGSYNAIVGGGGVYVSFLSQSLGNGKNSSFNLQTAIGGGAGGSNDITGSNGGSGGGAGGFGIGIFISGGLGTPDQGFNGGNKETTNISYAGGGGGASQKGGVATSVLSAPGGSGSQWLDGNFYAGGGGGVGSFDFPTRQTGGLGGPGGGGNGGIFEFAVSGSNGQPNTGGGAGGGSGTNTPAIGGSGIVIVRYAGTQKANGGDNIYSSGSYTYHEFKTVGTGSFSF